VLRQTAQRIAEHAAEHDLGRVEVVLHGGEPLLAGFDSPRDSDTEFHSASMSNFIDGDQAANDRHRRYANRRSSYDHVIRAIELLQAGASGRCLMARSAQR
jgi:uncharacterized protein